MSHTHKNLREVQDVAPDAGFGEVQEARFPRQDLKAERTGLAYHAMRPGKRGFGHRHEDAEEIYVVLSGSGKMKVDEEARLRPPPRRRRRGRRRRVGRLTPVPVDDSAKGKTFPPFEYEVGKEKISEYARAVGGGQRRVGHSAGGRRTWPGAPPWVRSSG